MIRGEALDVILRLQNLARFSAGMREAAGEIKAVGAEARAQTGATEAAMAGATKGAKVLGAAVVLAMFEGYRASVKFQDTMMQVHTAANAPIKDIKGLSNSILDLAHTVPQGPGQLAHALLDARKVTQDSAKALDATTQAARGAAIGHADLEDTVKALVGAQRVGIVGANNFHDAMASVWAITSQGGMSMGDFVNALGTQLLPTAKLAGLSLDEVGGALAVLTDEGQNADSAATHLRMAISLMQNPSKKAQDALAGIGLSAKQVGETMHGPNGLVSALTLIKGHLEDTFPTLMNQIHHLDLTTPEGMKQAQNLVSQQQTLLQAFGGARSAATVMLLLNQIDLIDRKTKATTDQTKKYGQAWEDYNKTAYARLHRAWSGIQADLIRFGDSFRDLVTPVIIGFILVLDIAVRALTFFFNIFRSLPKPVQDVLKVFFILTGVLIGAVAMFYLGIAAVGVFGAALDALELSIIAASIALDFLVANPIILALALFAIGVYLLVTHWKEVKHAAGDAIGFMKDQLALFIFFFPVLSAAVLGVIWVANQLKDHFEGVKKVIGEIGGVGRDVFGWIENASKNTLNVMISMINGIVKALNVLIDGYNFLPFHKDVGHIASIGKVGGRTNTDSAIATPFATSAFQPFATASHESAISASAQSNREKRAHTPNPTSLREEIAHPLESHIDVKIGESTLLKVVAKGTARKKAKK